MHFKALTATSRKDNEKSLVTLKNEKVVFTEPAGPEVIAAFERMGEEARRALVGKLYTNELLEKISTALKQFRAKKKA